MRTSAITGLVVLGAGSLLLAGCAGGTTAASGGDAEPADIPLSYS